MTTENDRIGCLDVGFQQVALIQISWNLYNIIMKYEQFKLFEVNYYSD